MSQTELPPEWFRLVHPLHDQRRAATMAVDWIVRLATPTWLRKAGLVTQADLFGNLMPIENIEALTPMVLPELLRAAQYAHMAWDEGVAESGWICRDVARAAASSAVAMSGWPEVAGASWSHPWPHPIWGAAWNVCKTATRFSTWIAARDAAAPIAGQAAINNAAWGSAHAAACEHLMPLSLILRNSARALAQRMQEDNRA